MSDCGCRFGKHRIHAMDCPHFVMGEEPMVAGLNESVEVFRLFRVEGRTGLTDLLPALRLMDARLEHYDGVNKNKWRRQSIDTHLLHAVNHLSRALQAEAFYTLSKQLTAASLRIGFALTLLVLRRPILDPDASLSDLRADTTEV